MKKTLAELEANYADQGFNFEIQMDYPNLTSDEQSSMKKLIAFVGNQAKTRQNRHAIFNASFHRFIKLFNSIELGNFLELFKKYNPEIEIDEIITKIEAIGRFEDYKDDVIFDGAETRQIRSKEVSDIGDNESWIRLYVKFSWE